MVVVLTHLSIMYSFNQQTYTKHLCANSGNTNKRRTNLYPLHGDRWVNQLSVLRIIAPQREEMRMKKWRAAWAQREEEEPILLGTLRKSFMEEVILQRRGGRRFREANMNSLGLSPRMAAGMTLFK